MGMTRIIKMITPEGFDDLFTKELNNYPTQEKTFEALNAEYKAATGDKRYENWESYRVTRLLRIKKKLQKRSIAT